MSKEEFDNLKEEVETLREKFNELCSILQKSNIKVSFEFDDLAIIEDSEDEEFDADDDFYEEEDQDSETSNQSKDSKSKSDSPL